MTFTFYNFLLLPPSLTMNPKKTGAGIQTKNKANPENTEAPEWYALRDSNPRPTD